MTGRYSVRRQTKWVPGWFRLSPAAFGLVLLLEFVFVHFSHHPLWHTDLWGHLAYGRLIVDERGLPQTEPLMPLSSGVPFIDLAWLSQVLGYLAFRWQGIAAIQFLYAATITASLGLLAFRTSERTAAIWTAALSVVVCTWLEWQQFLIVRPQLAGVVCFVVLFVLLTPKRLGSAPWVCVTILFAAWSNLHGSFPAGLALLAAFVAGRAGDILRRTGSVRAIYLDRRLRQTALLMLCAGAAVLVNPYGWRIFQDVWRTATNPNLADLVEWRPLTITMRQGRAAAVIAVVLVIVYRVTPRRVSVVEFLVLVGLGTAALRTSRMIVWWAPVAAYYLAIHASAIGNRIRRRRHPFAMHLESFTSPAWAVAAVVIGCWLFADTPLGAEFLGGRQTDIYKGLSAETPIDATVFLKEHPPNGQIFNTYEWGDYLLWAGPPGLQVFVAAHAHLIPSKVWEDYLAVITLKDGWQTILRQYGANTAVLNPIAHAELVDALRKQCDWSIGFEDERSVIFFRRPPNSRGNEKPAS